MFRAVWRVLRRHRSYCGECGEDIVMKAFHELMRKGLDGVTSPVGLAVTIAHRRAFDVVGRSSRETPCAAFDDVEDDELLAEELLRREELFTQVTSCLDRRPDRQRIAFVETVMKDRPVKEVAQEELGGVTTQATYALRAKATRRIRGWTGRGLGRPVDEPNEGNTE